MYSLDSLPLRHVCPAQFDSIYRIFISKEKKGLDGDPEFAASVDFDRLMKQLKELNGVAGENRASLVKKVDEAGVIHQFEYPQGVPLILWSDG